MIISSFHQQLDKSAGHLDNIFANQSDDEILDFINRDSLKKDPLFAYNILRSSVYRVTPMNNRSLSPKYTDIAPIFKKQSAYTKVNLVFDISRYDEETLDIPAELYADLDGMMPAAASLSARKRRPVRFSTSIPISDLINKNTSNYIGDGYHCFELRNNKLPLEANKQPKDDYRVRNIFLDNIDNLKPVKQNQLININLFLLSEAVKTQMNNVRVSKENFSKTRDAICDIMKEARSRHDNYSMEFALDLQLWEHLKDLKIRDKEFKTSYSPEFYNKVKKALDEEYKNKPSKIHEMVNKVGNFFRSKFRKEKDCKGIENKFSDLKLSVDGRYSKNKARNEWAKMIVKFFELNKLRMESDWKKEGKEQPKIGDRVLRRLKILSQLYEEGG